VQFVWLATSNKLSFSARYRRVDRLSCLPFLLDNVKLNNQIAHQFMTRLQHYLSRIAFLPLGLAAASFALAQQTPPTPATDSAKQAAIFAKVGDQLITQDEYAAAYNAASRAKFYHGKPPESELAALQREVADQMVTRILLIKEIKRKGLKPDAAEIDKQIQAYEKRYAGSDQWKKNKDKMLPPLVARLEQDDMLAQIEKSVRDEAKASEEQAKAYFAAHPDKFTEPEQLRLSVILIKVDPSATSATWAKADETAQALAKRARAGEDFAALARQYSADDSSKQGGDMGYLHSGMLPEGTQNALSKLKAGEVSNGIRLLEGFTVFRLTDRKDAKKHDYNTVKVRARELAQREQSDVAWAAFIANLKSKTSVKIDESRYMPLAK
jgi:parvulin-like peptidyl-prolyl isomerase